MFYKRLLESWQLHDQLYELYQFLKSECIEVLDNGFKGFFKVEDGNVFRGKVGINVVERNLSDSSPLNIQVVVVLGSYFSVLRLLQSTSIFLLNLELDVFLVLVAHQIKVLIPLGTGAPRIVSN